MSFRGKRGYSMSAHNAFLGQQARRLMLASSLAMVLNGCQSGGNMFSSSADPSDSCGREHVAFADSKSFYLQETMQGALLGGLGGAALGAIGAAATGGDAGKGALIGGGVGLIAGGAAGYFNARQKDAADRTQLAGSINSDISQAANEIDRTSTTFAALKQCRFNTVAQIKAQVRQGSLARDRGATQIADQKRRFDDELALARQYGTKMAQQDDSFRFASEQLVKDDPEAQSVMATRSAQIAAANAPTMDYVATAGTNVRSGPSAGSAKIDTVAKGDHVRVFNEGGSGSWRKVNLDDGTTGFVSAQYLALSSATPRPSPTTATASNYTPPPRPPVTSTNRNVQVAVGATETIPEKRVAYDHSVDDASKQSTLAFNLDSDTSTS